MQGESVKPSGNWMKPPPGGYRNSRAAGFVIGVAFGPIGVGLFLRSILDFVLSLAMCLSISYLAGEYAGPLSWAACGIWVVARMKREAVQGQGPPPNADTGVRLAALQSVETHAGSI